VSSALAATVAALVLVLLFVLTACADGARVAEVRGAGAAPAPTAPAP